MDNIRSDRIINVAGYTSTGNFLGEGTFGLVVEGIHEETGKLVAIKKTHVTDDDDGIPATSLREIATLKRLKHKNLVRLLDVYYQPLELYLVFDRHPKDLRTYLYQINPEVGLDPEERKHFLTDILSGINYLHTQLLLHRDLKPGNILVTKEGILKIADFGLVRNFVSLNGPLTHEVVTLWYRPPEILIKEEDEYDFTTDIWSIGCIFAEFYLLGPFFDGRSDIGQLFAIFEKLGTPNDEIWPGFSSLHAQGGKFPLFRPKEIKELIPSIDTQAADLMKKLLVYPKEKRISCLEALKHPYLTSKRPAPSSEPIEPYVRRSKRLKAKASL